MNWDLQLEKEGEEWILYKYQGLVPSGKLCEWRTRKAFLQDWLDGSGDRDFTEILKDIPSILKKSTYLTSPEHKQRVADWVIDALFLEQLSPEWEDVLCQTVQTFLFQVLIPRFSDKNMGSCPKELQSELHYTLRRWFTLINDSRRSWFERSEHGGREQALQKAIFDSQGQIYSFYALPGFPELTKDFARWFLRRYDLPHALKLFQSLRCSSPPSQTWSVQALLWGIPFVFILLFALTCELSPAWLPLLLAGKALLFLFSLYSFLEVLLPRMLAGTAIGYLFVLPPGQGLWEIILNKHTSIQQICLLAILVFLASGAYLYVGEVSKVTHSIREATRRTLLILLIGLAQSVTIGFILSLIVSLPIFASLKINPKLWSALLVEVGECLGVPFAFCPKALLFQVPVALFVGIVSQILWQEKPITESL
ncbi:MAG: hypothetical protein HYZ50_18460 [Deltaproteobacteria bacterium]|nr:hypothetical protein [Deltaproteobacteria bacterium]